MRRRTVCAWVTGVQPCALPITTAVPPTRPERRPKPAMNDPSADPAQQKQRLRERLRFRRKHSVANLDAIARLAAFRALPQPLADLIADRDPIAAYIAWGDEPDILPMLDGLPLALPPPARKSTCLYSSP